MFPIEAKKLKGTGSLWSTFSQVDMMDHKIAMGWNLNTKHNAEKL